MGIRHCRSILEGRASTIFTDHKPLAQALSLVSDSWTARQCRHLAYVAEFKSDIQPVAGQENVAADAMSRPPVPSLSSPSLCATVVTTYVELIHDSCPARARHKRAALPPSRYGPEVEGVTMLCDTSTDHLRLLVP